MLQIGLFFDFVDRSMSIPARVICELNGLESPLSFHRIRRKAKSMVLSRLLIARFYQEWHKHSYLVLQIVNLIVLTANSLFHIATLIQRTFRALERESFALDQCWGGFVGDGPCAVPWFRAIPGTGMHKAFPYVGNCTTRVPDKVSCQA